MRRCSLILLLLAVLSGCATRPVTLRDTLARPRRSPAANVLFGPDRVENRVASLFVGRAPEPAAYGGYLFADEEHAAVATFDDQVYYDRDGGGFGRVAESYRNRVVFR